MNHKQIQVNAAYETWEPLLKEKLNQLEIFLDAIKNDLSSCGINRKEAAKFLNEKVDEIRKEIQERRVNKYHRRVV